MKEYLVETEVNGGEYIAYTKIENVESVDMVDNFYILINDKIKIGFDEKILNVRRILK